MQRQKDRLKDQVSKQTTNLLALSTARALIWKSKNYLGEEEGNNLPPTSTNVSPIWKVENSGSQFFVTVTQSGMCWVTEWIEHGKGRSFKKSKTTLSCNRLFENKAYNGQIKFLCGIFYEAMCEHLRQDTGDEGSMALSFGKGGISYVWKREREDQEGEGGEREEKEK
jgi:hypothetical protein